MKFQSLAGLAVLGAMLAVVTPATAQPPDVKATVKSALVGLPGVYVHLTEASPIGQFGDVSPRFLRQTVEDRLREAGIRVLSREELASTPGTPILEVQVCLLRHDTIALFQYSIETVLWERVRLDRDPDLVVQAVTWRSGVKFGNALGELVSGRIQDVFDFEIGNFINDYDAANERDRNRDAKPAAPAAPAIEPAPAEPTVPATAEPSPLPEPAQTIDEVPAEPDTDAPLDPTSASPNDAPPAPEAN
jgi:hypothetical protein